MQPQLPRVLREPFPNVRAAAGECEHRPEQQLPVTPQLNRLAQEGQEDCLRLSLTQDLAGHADLSTVFRHHVQFRYLSSEGCGQLLAGLTTDLLRFSNTIPHENSRTVNFKGVI